MNVTGWRLILIFLLEFIKIINNYIIKEKIYSKKKSMGQRGKKKKGVEQHN